jgi:hypothetical protein
MLVGLILLRHETKVSVAVRATHTIVQLTRFQASVDIAFVADASHL